ncbi:MAG: M24 family metallopeptidase [Eubacteriales bacterium]|nr:M24 family metallopeptidase [Eubacteriales bacterium]
MKIWRLNKKVECFSSKKLINNLKKEIKDKYLFITDEEEVCYILNLRGQDEKYTPIFRAKLIIAPTFNVIYLDKEKITKEVKDYLDELDIFIKDYNDFKKDEKKFTKEKFESNISFLKSIKTKKEIQNIKRVHKIDGEILTNFIKFVKTIDFDKEYWTEKMLMEELDNRRKKHKDFVCLSFKTIMAYKESAATIHYDVPTNKRDKSKRIKNEGFLLIDSGATYQGGTTDVTRTIKLGKLTKEEKRNYKIVKKAFLKLVNHKFKQGTKGYELDKIARDYMNKYNLDYNHGTGHGVGYMLSVHESPPTITRKRKENNILFGDSEIFENQVVSIEPGVYFENKYGIRIEDLAVVKKDEKGILYFDILTKVPIE